MSWSLIQSTAQEPGSEGGAVVLDEEHELGARITLETPASFGRFAITCGIYGWMVHTRFFDQETDAYRAFEAMKQDIDAILKTIPASSDPDSDRKIDAVSRAISSFVDKYPT